MAKKKGIQRIKKSLNIPENKLDKYFEYYHSNAPLSEDEMLMLEKYRKAWSSLSLGQPHEMTISILMRDYAIQERQARYIIAEAGILYGSGITDIDKQGKRRASANYHRLLSNLARQNEDYETASKAWERADKLEGVYEEEKAGLDPDDFMKAAKFVFIDNVNILKQQIRPDDE